MDHEKPSLLGILYQPKVELQRLNDRPVFGFALVIIIIATLVPILLAIYLFGDQDAKSVIFLLVPLNDGLQQENYFISIIFDVLLGIPLQNLLFAFFCWVLVLILKGKTAFRKMFALLIYLRIIPIIGIYLFQILFFVFFQFVEDTKKGAENIILIIIVSALGYLFAYWYYSLLANGLKTTTTLSTGKAKTISILLILLQYSFLMHNLSKPVSP